MEITRSYRWDMGHRLRSHQGLCRNPHGHSYTAEVTVRGPLTGAGPEEGMVLDFSRVDSAIRECVGHWDHAFMLQSGDPLAVEMTRQAAALGEDWRVVVVPFAPTAENMALEIAKRLETYVPGISAVTVWETPRSSATWRRP